MRSALAAICLLLAGCAVGSGEWWGDGGAPTQLVLGSTDQGCSFSPDIADGSCCIGVDGHDSKYWVGGTEQDRLAADAELLACLALYGVPEPVAFLYYAGVRVFGWIRWDYTGTRVRGPPR